MELTDEEVEALGTRGYFLRTAFLGEARARAMRDAAQARVDSGLLRPAGIRRGADRTLDADVRGDLIGWLQPEPGSPLTPLWESFRELGEALSSAAYLGLGRFDVQLACYPGGGTRYARHRDAFPGQSNRRATAIWYANANWEPSRGGELRLYPEGREPVDVAPVLDTLVVFLSEVLDHEVLPARAPRLALTAWYYGRDAG